MHWSIKADIHGSKVSSTRQTAMEWNVCFYLSLMPWHLNPIWSPQLRTQMLHLLENFMRNYPDTVSLKASLSKRLAPLLLNIREEKNKCGEMAAQILDDNSIIFDDIWASAGISKCQNSCKLWNIFIGQGSSHCPV